MTQGMDEIQRSGKIQEPGTIELVSIIECIGYIPSIHYFIDFENKNKSFHSKNDSYRRMVFIGNYYYYAIKIKKNQSIFNIFISY